MARMKQWLMLLGLPLLAALATTLLDTGAIYLAQRPMLREQQLRVEELEDKMANRDLTQMDDTYIIQMEGERRRAQREIDQWREEHSLIVRLDRIQLLPSIVFWAVYFLMLTKQKRKEPTA